MTQIRLLIKQQQEMQKFANKIPGRNLSTHVDNVNPDKKIVNITYNNNINNINTPGVNPSQTTLVNNNQMMVGENTNINNNISSQVPSQVQSDTNYTGVNYPMMNSQNNINNMNINKTNNLIPQTNENRPNITMNNMMNIPAMPNTTNISTIHKYLLCL